MKTLINIPEELIFELDKISKQNNSSRASIIRQAITQFLSNVTSSKSNTAFGIWKNKKIDSLDYQEKIRKEWD